MSIGYCRIKSGATVFQDHSFPVWGVHIGIGEVDRPFIITEQNSDYNSYTLRAFGYGLLGEKIYDSDCYGNGALFVKSTDVVIIPEIDAAGYSMQILSPESTCVEVNILDTAFKALEQLKIINEGVTVRMNMLADIEAALKDCRNKH